MSSQILIEKVWSSPNSERIHFSPSVLLDTYIFKSEMRFTNNLSGKISYFMGMHDNKAWKLCKPHLQSFSHMADRITITYSKHACLIWSAGLQEDTFCQQNLDFCGGFNQMLVAAINVLCECSFYLGLYFASYINLQFIIKLNDGIIKCKTMMTNRQHVNKKRKRKLIFTLLLTEKLPNSSLISQQLYHYTRIYSSHTAASEAEKSAQCFSHI